MNRRSFFRLGAGLAGAAAVAPKLLLEPIVVPVDKLAANVAFGPVSAYKTYAEFMRDFGPEPFFQSLIKLCKQFFSAGFWTVTEDYKRGIVNIDASVLDTENLFLFKTGLHYIRPIGVMVNLNGQSALLPYDFMDIEKPRSL